MTNTQNGQFHWNKLRRFISARCLWLVVVWFNSTVAAQAHDPGLSSADVRLEAERLSVQLTLNNRDIESIVLVDVDKDSRVTSLELTAARARLQTLASKAFAVQIDGHRLPAGATSVQLTGNDDIRLSVSFAAKVEAAGSRLNVRSDILDSLTRGHRQYFSLRDERGKVLKERMLDADNNAVEVPLTQSSAAEARPHSFWQFLLLGVEHILTGYDHLAFVFSLLIVAGSLGAVVKIITSFTVAHSITLTLATLDVVHIPSQVVEPLIALSIIYVGLENLFSRDPRHLQRRWMLTFTFGLIHGFGFATVLRELGIGSDTGAIVAPLVTFNLGVELGQIAIAALALPVIWKLRSHRLFVPRYVPACSLFITLAGAYWLIERTLLR